jgi:hypothetical protein
MHSYDRLKMSLQWFANFAQANYNNNFLRHRKDFAHGFQFTSIEIARRRSAVWEVQSGRADSRTLWKLLTAIIRAS